MSVETGATPRPDIETVIADGARGLIAQAVSDNDDGEVFFVGKLAADALVVEEIYPCSFGGDEATPAITQMAEDGDVVIHNHPSGELKPSQADVQIASALGERSIGFYIVDNACSRVHVVVPAFERERLTLLNPDEIDRLLGLEGALARGMANYEYREQQAQMAEEVCRAFNEDRIAVIEAGTGTGKSMAYLTPAVLWAVANRERVVVSTNTINLQEQLIHKDLPFLAKHLGVKFSAELIKGRGNYICLRKIGEAESRAREMFEPMVGEQLRDLFEWSKTTKDGSLSDLPYRPDSDLWEEVRSESDTCLRVRCKRYAACLYYKARRRASTANILVANHALVTVDLALRKETENYTEAMALPPYRRVILDEGHNLEDAATRAFSTKVTATGLRRMCRKWVNPQRRGAGVLSAFVRRLHEFARTEDPKVIERIDQLASDEVRPEAEQLPAFIAEVSERLIPPLRERLERDAPNEPGQTRRIRITAKTRATALWADWIEPVTGQLRAALQRFLTRAQRLLKETERLTKATQQKALPALIQVEANVSRMQTAVNALQAFCEDDENVCAWIEYADPRRMGDPPILRWCSGPIELGPLLRQALFDPSRTAVVTSATMTVNDKFDYTLGRLGLVEGPEGYDFPDDPESHWAPYQEEDREWDPDAPAFQDSGPEAAAPETSATPSVTERLIHQIIDSPFDYPRQAFVAAPRDLPEPNRPDYESAVSDCVARAVRVSQGRAFVLFTSYGMLNRVAARLAPDLEAEGFSVLRQGDVARHLLLEQFRTAPRAVLFATSSFWEGVDVQGDALVLLIMARLPFSVPSEPILEARVEAIERRGGDPFGEFSLPTAVIRFKQGFGRLIRSRSDTGAILILDSRVVRKFYGRVFLRSLPTQEIWQGKAEQLWPELERFFQKREE